jgi:hypothetical protein
MKRYTLSKKWDGITRKSTDYIKKHLPKIGKVKSVRVYKVKVKDRYHPSVRTSIKGSKGTIIVGGFLYGYFGQGPRALVDLLVSLGMNRKQIEDDVFNCACDYEYMPIDRTQVTVFKYINES